jgi:hypothetical protein
MADGSKSVSHALWRISMTSPYVYLTRRNTRDRIISIIADDWLLISDHRPSAIDHRFLRRDHRVALRPPRYTTPIFHSTDQKMT